MLEGLNGVEWHTLTHAYGPATDMPDVIQALAADDVSLRQRALEYLNDALWQSGGVTRAAAYTVPFLIELLGAPEAREKRGIILLLARLAGGRAASESPAGGGLPPDRWNAYDGKAQQWTSAAMEALERGTRVYLRQLYSADVEVRIATPYLLSKLPTQAKFSVPPLGKRLAQSGEPRVRASILFALGALATPNPQALAQLSRLIGEGNPPLVQIAAAGALVLLARERAPSTASAVLAEAIAKPDPNVTALYEQLPWSKSGLTGDLAATLAWLGPKAGGFAVSLLCRALGASALAGDGGEEGTPSANGALNCMRTLLHLAFEGRSRAAPLILARLNENQRMTLTAIAQSDAVWRFPAQAAEMLGALALPNTRAALRQSLQLPV